MRFAISQCVVDELKKRGFICSLYSKATYERIVCDRGSFIIEIDDELAFLDWYGSNRKFGAIVSVVSFELSNPDFPMNLIEAAVGAGRTDK